MVKVSLPYASKPDDFNSNHITSRLLQLYDNERQTRNLFSGGVTLKKTRIIITSSSFIRLFVVVVRLFNMNIQCRPVTTCAFLKSIQTTRGWALDRVQTHAAPLDRLQYVLHFVTLLP